MILLPIILVWFAFKMSSVNLGVSILMSIMLILYSHYYYKAFFHPLPYLVKIIKRNELLFTEYLPKHLIRKFKKKFKNTETIDEKEYDDFLIKNMARGEAVAYFEKRHNKTYETFAKISEPLTPIHSSSTQKFHISYYDENNRLKIITTVKNKIITEPMLKSFLGFIRERKKKGEKVYETDVNEWSNNTAF